MTGSPAGEGSGAHNERLGGDVLAALLNSPVEQLALVGDDDDDEEGD